MMMASPVDAHSEPRVGRCGQRRRPLRVLLISKSGSPRRRMLDAIWNQEWPQPPPPACRTHFGKREKTPRTEASSAGCAAHSEIRTSSLLLLQHRLDDLPAVAFVNGPAFPTLIKVTNFWAVNAQPFTFPSFFATASIIHSAVSSSHD